MVDISSGPHLNALKSNKFSILKAEAASKTVIHFCISSVMSRKISIFQHEFIGRTQIFCQFALLAAFVMIFILAIKKAVLNYIYMPKMLMIMIFSISSLQCPGLLLDGARATRS